jgi:protein-S-isoprenylcysteine O-methyltransferase Ste14
MQSKFKDIIKKMEANKKTLTKRATISLTLLFSLVMMPVSGVIIHVLHGTKTSHTWLHLHVIFGVIFIVAGIYHVLFNWRAMKNYLIGKK